MLVSPYMAGCVRSRVTVAPTLGARDVARIIRRVRISKEIEMRCNGAIVVSAQRPGARGLRDGRAVQQESATMRADGRREIGQVSGDAVDAAQQMRRETVSETAGQ
ncbi:hypothetical protein DIE18_36650 [Burkholderia sp. Bp9125]|nr:hypothetical protein DIE18_36650 [Burkholderia sp. Bp9125]